MKPNSLGSTVNVDQDIFSKRQSFPWKLFLIILALALLAAIVKIPAVIYSIGAADQPQDWMLISVMSALQDVIPFGIFPAFFGLLLANRTGFDLPLIKALLARKPLGKLIKNEALAALISALILSIVAIIVLLVLKPAVQNDFASQGLSLSDFEGGSQAPYWAMGLASFSAGTLEEIGFRLGLMSLVAFLGGLLWKDAAKHPASGVIWTAIFLVALLFGALHISNITTLGLPLTTSLIVYAVIGNCLPGILFGWLYWKRGLETAILTHIIFDLCVHVLFPFGMHLFA